MKTQAITDAKLFLEALATPEHFTKTVSEEELPHQFSTSGEKFFMAVFASVDAEIKINIYPKEIERFKKEQEIARATKKRSNYFGMFGDGHVSFDTSKGRMTFDRRGVSDSFYVDTDDTVETVNATIAEQISNIAASRERLARSVTMPDYGYNLTPERLEEQREILRKGGVARFAPAGFGTGHFISTNPKKLSRWTCKNASQALVDFFGVGMLFVEEFDHD